MASNVKGTTPAFYDVGVKASPEPAFCVGVNALLETSFCSAQEVFFQFVQQQMSARFPSKTLSFIVNIQCCDTDNCTDQNDDDTCFLCGSKSFARNKFSVDFGFLSPEQRLSTHYFFRHNILSTLLSEINHQIFECPFWTVFNNFLFMSEEQCNSFKSD